MMFKLPGLLIVSMAFTALAPAQQISECVRCHQVENPEILIKHRIGVHSRVGLGCVVCHGGNPAAKTRQQGHDVQQGYVSLLTSGDVLARCGSCHVAEHDFLSVSPHGAAAMHTGHPHCADCHSGHATILPKAVDQNCKSCHQEEIDPGRMLAGEMFELIEVAERVTAELTTVLTEINGSAPETKRRLLEIEQIRIESLHAGVRQFSHTLDLEGLRDSVAFLKESIATAVAVGHAELDVSRGFGWPVVVLIFIGLVGGLLLLSIVLAVLSFKLAQRLRNRRGQRNLDQTIDRLETRS